MKLLRSAIAFVLLTAPALRAQSAPSSSSAAMTTAAFDADLRFLSSDLLEGRAPATRGGQLASQYIATQLQIAGVQPGANGSYFQPVPIDVVGAVASTIRVRASGKASATLAYPADVVIGPGSASDSGAAHGHPHGHLVQEHQIGRASCRERVYSGV